eukprot:scaffold564_cov248-Pinguiococcus_pyrenoidosus.AAC.2
MLHYARIVCNVRDCLAWRDDSWDKSKQAGGGPAPAPVGSPKKCGKLSPPPGNQAMTKQPSSFIRCVPIPKLCGVR